MPLRKPLQNMSKEELSRWISRWWPVQPRIFPQGFGLPVLFGDGSDGDATISADTNFATGTLKQYRTLTIDSGKTLGCSDSTLGLVIILVRERCIINGTISMNGKGGAGSAGAAVSATDATDYSTSQAGSGGGGGSGSAGNGGAGGDTQALGGIGGIAGTAGSAGAAIGVYNQTIFRFRQDRKDYATNSWGTGGGGGGGDGVTAGGAGGTGGGALLLFAHDLHLTSGGTLSSNGNNGISGSAAGRGGGGGGGGGLIWIISTNFVDEGTSQAIAGTGGAAGGAGAGAGGAGGTGTIIKDTIPLT